MPSRFGRGHKNDFRDAHAVAEAVQRPTTRFVPAKTDKQLDLQALHRVRSRSLNRVKRLGEAEARRYCGTAMAFIRPMTVSAYPGRQRMGGAVIRQKIGRKNILASVGGLLNRLP
jgi:hypothetical protein